MKISVIIPTYNRANFLLKTIQSVLDQSILPYEIIVVDDGSTDETQAIIKDSPFYDKLIYLRQENKGVSSARNRGIDIAKGEWICFLDSDDIWYPSKLEKQIEFHKNNPNILFSHTNEEWIFNGKIIKQKKHQQKQSGFCFEQNIHNTLIGASTVMIHKTIFDKVGLFDESLKVCEDYDLWLRILSHYEVRLVEDTLIKKIAGHKEQLSFSTPLMDIYRIEALKKHLNSKYSNIVQKVISKKIEILLKGAKKHNNKEILDRYGSIS